jgi:hypothetical protein
MHQARRIDTRLERCADRLKTDRGIRDLLARRVDQLGAKLEAVAGHDRACRRRDDEAMRRRSGRWLLLEGDQQRERGIHHVGLLE